MELSIGQRIQVRLNQIRYRARTSSPLLSGDAFREIADFSISSKEELLTLKSSSAQGQVIFCQSDFIEDLISILGDGGRFKTLIAGNSDRDFEIEIKGLAKSFNKSFLQNSKISNNFSIFTLPIGVENLRLGINGLPKYLKSSRRWIDRKDSILVGPFSPTHKSRSALFAFEDFNLYPFRNIGNFLTPKAYAELVKKHRYVLCPRGNGLDTHRFWEALYRGAIPIIEKSPWSESLRIHDFPFVEVESFAPENIIERVKQEEKMSVFEDFDPRNVKSLWIDYWESLFLK